MYKWGNPLWHTLYVIAQDIGQDINKNEKKIIMMFLKHVVTILPCEKCRYHYKQHFDKEMSDYNNIDRNMVIDWLYNLDMSIKRDNGQPIIDKSERLIKMGKEIDKSRFIELLMSLRTFFYTNRVLAKDIYIFMVYLSILVPDNSIRCILKYKLSIENNIVNLYMNSNITEYQLII